MSRRYENEGRDQIPIETVHGNVYVGETRSRQRPGRELTWLKEIQKEVEKQLTDSLHNRVLINLGKQPQLGQVRRLWDVRIKSGQKPIEAISPDTEILEVFERSDIAGKLLILGKPGAGKTTTLLELARDLIKKAQEDVIAPMPVLLNLSSWNDSCQSLEDWIIKKMATGNSSAKAGSALSKRWLEAQKLLPMLDGLDEVRPDLQPACISAINQFLNSECRPASIIVCSRREEYEAHSEKLQLNGAIHLQELTNAQIEAYLVQVNRAALWQVLNTDSELLELVRQPLLLDVTLTVYSGELAERWKSLQSTQERLEFLLDAYIEQMLHQPPTIQVYDAKKEPTVKQTRQWLVRLAKQLQSESETEFLIEKMQPSWLTNVHQKWIYKLLVGLLVITPLGLIVVTLKLKFGLIIGVAAVLIYSLATELNYIYPVEKIRISQGQRIEKAMHQLEEAIRISERMKDEFKNIEELKGLEIEGLKQQIQELDYENEEMRQELETFRFQSIVTVTVVIIAGMISALIAGLTNGLNSGLYITFIIFLIIGLGTVLEPVSKTEIETRLYPNQGIFTSFSNTLILLSISLLVSILAYIALFLLLNHTLTKEEIQSFISLLFFFLALASFTMGGGLASVQHFSLRLVLFLSRAIPWNYARFLNYSTERMFLQRIGGRYRFIHKLLQDHFAGMKDEG
ncbi:MAG: NACHT domain-containing protein [Myxacorys chilensis ATA2-1-KO14]|jgi:DNA polymerase III delta prime subunit/F0F1-type ATP synthase assembly protein I|nr:NACHT domain-containing protein [Myxacorys chilensis ATA2-1-KO14]